MVDFVDAQVPGQLAPIGESVQASTQHHELTQTAGDRALHDIFRIALTCRDEESEAMGAGLAAGAFDDRVALIAQNTNCQRIVKDEPALQHLVGGPVPCGSPRRATRPTRMHIPRLVRLARQGQGSGIPGHFTISSRLSACKYSTTNCDGISPYSNDNILQICSGVRSPLARLSAS